MNKKIVVFTSLFLLVLFFFVITTVHDTPKYQPSDYTFESEYFYVDSIITINQLDDVQKNEIGTKKDFISFDITFNLVPKDEEKIFKNIKVDAFVNDEIIDILLIPSSNNIKSYEDKGANIGKDMPTFAISLGKLSWINQKILNELSISNDILKKDVTIDVSWNDGSESFVIPSDYLKIFIVN